MRKATVAVAAALLLLAGTGAVLYAASGQDIAQASDAGSTSSGNNTTQPACIAPAWALNSTKAPPSSNATADNSTWVPPWVSGNWTATPWTLNGTGPNSTLMAPCHPHGHGPRRLRVAAIAPFDARSS